jgi:AGCS family alanine or glycine:cation symporter
MMVAMIGTGSYLSIGLRGITLSRIPEALRLLASPEARGSASGTGEVIPYAALMSALSATVGVGNIAGVATAIHLGGPGAMFWMWLTALVGMGKKYAETFLAVTFRENVGGHFLGGPMYYIKLGLGRRWDWLGTAFAVFASVAALGVGASVQANAVSNVLDSQFGLPTWTTSIVIGLATFAVLIGGLRRIASISELLVPTMIIIFMSGGFLVLGMNIADLVLLSPLIFKVTRERLAAGKPLAAPAHALLPSSPLIR